MVYYDVPYFRSPPENTHCVQATLKMVLKYFWPERDFTWKQLEKITNKQPGKWTWSMAMLIWLNKNGFDVHAKVLFDYNQFADEGADYLKEKFGNKVAKEKIKHSVIDIEQKFAKKFSKLDLIEQEIPTQADIKRFLSDGYLVILSVNSRLLNKKPGYAGHHILITGLKGNIYTFNDAGVKNGNKDRKISAPELEKVWAYPNAEAKFMIAIKK